MARLKKYSNRNQSTKKKNEAKNDEIINDDITLTNESIAGSVGIDDTIPLINDDEPIQVDNYNDMTLEALAELAHPFSNRSIETLKRLKRAELIYIIENQKDDYKKSNLSTIDNDTKDLIELFLEIMNDIKQKREGKPVNAVLQKILRNQSKKISETLVKIGASGGIIAYTLLFGVIILIIIDSTIGLFSIHKLFNKSKKVNNEKKPNNYNNS